METVLVGALDDDASDGLRTRLCDIGTSMGLLKVGFASSETFAETRSILHARKAEGLNGSMQFTYRNPDRSTDPRLVLPDSKAIVVGALSYRQTAPEIGPEPVLTVARYATSDYYSLLTSALNAIAADLQSAGYEARVCVDSNALVDRAAAYRAGIGWWAKNSNLMIEGVGSWFVIGSVVTNADLATEGRSLVPDGCGSCTKCVTACPTQAIVADGVIDARRCLAWLLQADGSIPIEFRRSCGYRLYGCDDCQSSCPINRVADMRDAPPEPADEPGPIIEAIDVLVATDAELEQRFGRWYFARRDVNIWRRNALVAVGNYLRDRFETGAEPVVPLGAQTLEGSPPLEAAQVVSIAQSIREGSNAMLVEHAAWALEFDGCPVIAGRG